MSNKKRGRPKKPVELDAKNDIEAVSEIAKRKTKKQEIAEYGAEHTEPGDNARYLRQALVGYNLPPIDVADPEQVENRIQEYFFHCIDNDRKPSMVGIANWLGIDRSTLYTWKVGSYRSSTHSNIAKKAIGILEEMYVDYMMNGKVNPGSGCFIGKNHFGYRDVTENVLTMNQPLGAESTPEELAERYRTAIPETASPREMELAES